MQGEDTQLDARYNVLCLLISRCIQLLAYCVNKFHADPSITTFRAQQQFCDW